MRRIFLRYVWVAGVCSMVLPFLLLLSLVMFAPESKAQAQVHSSDQDEASIVAYNQHNLIRFHVIANSDSERDQALKQRIRDLVVEKMTPEFKKAQSLAEARQIALSHLEDIQKIAQDEISLWHEAYPVKVELGNFDFPIKTYGELTLPAGNYEAVRVVIGEGQGANWWCVLFPPLCFGDVSKGMAPLTVSTGKSSQIHQPQYTEARTQKTQVKVRFKILETLGFYKKGK